MDKTQQEQVDFGTVGTMLSSGGVGTMGVTESELTSSQLDLFQPAPNEDVMLYSRQCTYRPTQTLSDYTPPRFSIPSENGLYLDPASLRLNGAIYVMKIVNGEEINLTAADTPGVSLCQMFPYAMWRQLEVSFNGQMASFISSPCANYKAYIEHALTYGRDAAATHLQAARWNMEAPAECKTMTGETFNERAGWIKGSRLCDFSIPLHSDILKVNRLIPDGLSMDVVLSRAEDSTVICVSDAHKNERFRIKLKDLTLTANKIALRPEFLSDVERRLTAGQLLRYPLVRSTIKTDTILSGESTKVLTNLYNGKMPNTIIFGLVKTSAFSGNIRENPFYFGNFDLASVQLRVNSQGHPAEPYEPIYAPAATANPRYMREYRALCDNIGTKYGNLGCQITADHFKDGWTFYAFDLTPDGCNNLHKHVEERGVAELHLRFNEPATGSAARESLTAIVHASWNDEIQIDGQRVLYTSKAVEP